MPTMSTSYPSKPSRKLPNDAYKNVGFASSPVVGELRPPTHTEDWSLYYFESHVQSCKGCYSPSKRTGGQQKDGRVLCRAGQELARQVIARFYRHEGVVYSTLSTPDRMAQVEIPKRYKDCRNLLKTVARGAYPYTTITPQGQDTVADKPYHVEERRPAPTKTKHAVKIHQIPAEVKPSKPAKIPSDYPPNERHPAAPNVKYQHGHGRKRYHGQNIVDWPEYSGSKFASPRVYVHNDKENSRSRRSDNDDDAQSTCAVVGSRGYSFANKSRPMDSFEIPKPKGYNRKSHRHSQQVGYLDDLHYSSPYCTYEVRAPSWDRRQSPWSTSYYI